MTEAATYIIRGGDYESGGEASKNLKNLLKKIGVDPQAVRRTMVAAYEAEMNVVIHARRGVMRVAVSRSQVDVSLTDEGPGIPDIDQAMREGFSTAPPEARQLGFGAGMGLPNIRRNTDRFSIQSTVGRGAHLRFSIFLGPQDGSAPAANSVHVAEGRCLQCLKCLHTCPALAIRVRDGRPRILDHLCIDCTACIAVCEPHALTMSALDELPAPREDTVLVLPVSFLEQFGAGARPQDVLEAVRGLGYTDVRLGEEWDIALRMAVFQHAAEAAEARPVLSPVCPAVVNLIQARFPSLLGHVAPFASPIEAACHELAVAHAVFVPACPSHLTLLRAPNVLTRIDVVLPAAMRRAVLAGLGGRRRSSPGTVPPAARQPILQVSGIGHVMRVLDEIENGAMDDYDVLELYACDQGCFGSPVWTEDPFVTRPRFDSAAEDLYRSLQDRRSDRPGDGVVRRTAPLAPRTGMRLDPDMKTAIEQLARIDALAKRLPGRNCGVCGSPNCAALAEDAVLGRAPVTACAYLEPNPADAGGA